MKSVVLMFDIVDSRRYLERMEVQEIVLQCIQYLNQQYVNQIKKDTVVSAGDEFQGLFYDLQSAFSYAHKLQLLIYPIKIRCAISSGEIKYDGEQWHSNEIDGEAYYRCREVMNKIAKEKKNVICFNTSGQFDKYINILCKSSSNIKTKQSEAAHMIELLADILCPIRKLKEDSDFYSYLSEKREVLIKNESWNKVTGKTREISLQDIDYNYIDAMKEKIRIPEQNKDFISNDFWAHGMSTIIAEAIGTSPQNTNKYISSGKIKESRTIDKAIYDFLGEIKCEL